METRFFGFGRLASLVIGAGALLAAAPASAALTVSPILTSSSDSGTATTTSGVIQPIMVVTPGEPATTTLISSAPCYKALTATTKTIKKTTSTLDLNVEYPQIGQAAIDKDVRDFIGVTIKDFGPGEKSDHWKSSLWISYKISQYQDKTVSIRFYIYTFTGGAHGSQDVNFRTYALKSGQRLSYSDIFRPDYEYLTALWKNSEPQVIAAYKARGLAMDKDELAWIREGSKPNFGNYRNFYLDDSGLTVYFGQYQAAPYAYGTLEVPVKYAKFGTGLSDTFKNLPSYKVLCGSR